MNIRTQLKAINEVRQSFIGQFVRFGRKHGKRSGPTVLLINIYPVKRNDINYTINGPKMTDHLWFNLTQQFQALNLVSGDNVLFDARVKPYRKGSYKRGIPVSIDYKLSHPYKLYKF